MSMIVAATRPGCRAVFPDKKSHKSSLIQCDRWRVENVGLMAELGTVFTPDLCQKLRADVFRHGFRASGNVCHMGEFLACLAEEKRRVIEMFVQIGRPGDTCLGMSLSMSSEIGRIVSGCASIEVLDNADSRCLTGIAKQHSS